MIQAAAIKSRIVEITYVDKGTTRTLVFEEPKYTDFKRCVPKGPRS
jgi:hypothetical protein